MVSTQPIDLTRELLGEFIPNPRTIRAFENINLNNEALIETVDELQAVPLIGITLSDVLSDDRFLDSGSDITFTDGGPKGSLTFGLTDTGVMAATYGSATQIAQIAVDAKGRLTLASNITLNSDNVAEGTVNLYFTQARARGSFSAGTGINYNSGTGVIAVSSTTVSVGSYGSASEVATFTVNAQGQLTAAANVTMTAAAIGAVPTSRTLTAGAGLTGGGDMSADRTFDVGAGTGITVNANDVALNTASSRNTDHAAVILTAGAGLTGGGDISASRTFNIGAGTGISVAADAVSIADTAVTPGTYGSATSVPSFTVDQQGRLTAASGNIIPALDSGTYTPTLTNVSNLDASTAYSCQYMRVGNTVTVSGRVDIDPTAANTLTRLGISLPIASSFVNFNECAGTAEMSSDISDKGGAIIADATNDRAQLQFRCGATTSNYFMFFTFTYRILT